jgi:flagellar protein FlbD
MIRLIKTDGVEFLLNVDLIKSIEEIPETVITLINGEKIEVKNNIQDVLTKISAYRIGLDAEKEEEEQPTES